MRFVFSNKKCKMVLLGKAKFLDELNILFSKSQLSGSVRIVMKLILVGKQSTDTKQKLELPKSRMLLIRATFKNIKISTQIPANEVESFQEEYCVFLRNSLNSLKKPKKPKKKPVS